MAEQVELIRSFLQQVEKALRTRKLYAPETPSYQEVVI